MAYEIEFDPGALKDLKRLDRSVQRRLLEFLRTRVANLDDPRQIGGPLAGPRIGVYWKYRVGDWRIICDIQDQKIVIRVLRIGHRGAVYRRIE